MLKNLKNRKDVETDKDVDTAPENKSGNIRSLAAAPVSIDDQPHQPLIGAPTPPAGSIYVAPAGPIGTGVNIPHPTSPGSVIELTNDSAASPEEYWTEIEIAHLKADNEKRLLKSLHIRKNSNPPAVFVIGDLPALK